MARQRTYSLEFKRLVAQQYLSGEFSLAALARQHDMSRSLIRIWMPKYEAGEFDDETVQGDILTRYEARIAELERKVGQLVMENEWLLSFGIRTASRGFGRNTPLFGSRFPGTARSRGFVLRLQTATSSWVAVAVAPASSPSRAWEKHHPEQLLESHEVRALQVDAGDPVDASFCHSSVSESVTIGKNSIVSTSEAGIRICETESSRVYRRLISLNGVPRVWWTLPGEIHAKGFEHGIPQCL